MCVYPPLIAGCRGVLTLAQVAISCINLSVRPRALLSGGNQSNTSAQSYKEAAEHLLGALALQEEDATLARTLQDGQPEVPAAGSITSTVLWDTLHSACAPMCCSVLLLMTCTVTMSMCASCLCNDANTALTPPYRLQRSDMTIACEQQDLQAFREAGFDF